MIVTVDVRTDPALRARLDRATPKALVTALRRSARHLLGPTVRAAQERTPVKTGRLRASLGVNTAFQGATGTFQAYVEPRREFTFTAAAGRKGLGRAGTRIRHTSRVALTAKQLAKGLRQDDTRVWAYALGVETGVRSDGKRARKAGGAHMLAGGLAATRGAIIERFGAVLMTHLSGGAPPTT